MTGKLIKTFMTAVFELKSPTKTKITVLNNRFLNYHITFEELLEDTVSSGLDQFINQKIYYIRDHLKDRLNLDPVFSNRLKHRHLSSAMKDGLIDDLAASIQSYCKLKVKYDADMENDNISSDHKEKLSPPGIPTIPSLISVSKDWENRLQDMASVATLEKETEARNQLLKESKAGQFRPIPFPRHRITDGFCMLQHKTKSSFYILFNLNTKNSRFSRKVDLSAYKVLDTKNTHKHTKTGLVFPINFGKSYQYNQFLRWIVENTENVQDAPIIKPKTARLFKRDNRFEAHVNFEISRTSKEHLTWLGVDRGINNIASLCVLRKNGDILAEENFSGKELKYVQKRMEQRQKTDQKKGKKYRSSSTRLTEANKTVHSIANRIVALAEKHHAQVVMENLINLSNRKRKRVRSNFNRLLQRQQYSKLQAVMLYKLRRAGLPDACFIAPAYTSSTCPECGNTAKENRNREDPKNKFLCQSCGYEHDADLNAARVIALKKIWRNELPKHKNRCTVKELELTEFSFSSFLKNLAN